MTRAVAAILLALVLAACGKASTDSIDSMDELVERICSNKFELDSGTMPYAAESGVCDIGDGTYVAWFHSQKDRDQYLDHARRIPGFGDLVIGDKWVVSNVGESEKAILEAAGGHYERDDPGDDRDPCKECDYFSDEPTP
jgi:hypothetical protein